MADESTGELMQTLYRLRGEDSALTKADALRLAQLNLMGSEVAQTELKNRGLTLDDEEATEAVNRGPSPYYWAPFVLMGNWL